MPRKPKASPVDVVAVPRKSPRKRPASRASNAAEGAEIAASSGGAASMGDDLAGEAVLLFAGVPGIERVKVFREDERTKKPVFHGNLSVEEASIDRVTELFGGGKYVLRATTRAADGTEVFATSRTMLVPGAYKPVVGNLPGVGLVTVGATAPTVQMVPSSGSEIREIMESALAGKLMDLLKPTAPVAVAAPMDWAKMLAAVGTLITAVTPLLESRNKGEPMMVTLFQQMQEDLKALKNQPTPQQSGMKDLLSTMRGMAEMKDLLSGGGNDTPKEEGGDKMWELAAKALSVLTGQNAPAPAHDPAVVGSIAPGAAPAMQPWQQLLVEYSPRLMDSAQRAVEPELVAELVARYVPEHQRGTLMELVQQPNVAELIVSVVPGMANYPAWLAQFVKACQEEMLGTPGEASDDKGGDE